MLDGERRSQHFFALFILCSILTLSNCLHCLEGSDCLLDASCGECSGVACTRIVSHNLDDNREIALTCLPFDTRTYEMTHPQLEVEGCRLVGDRQICICYSHNYCNSTKTSKNGLILLIFFFFSFLFIQ